MYLSRIGLSNYRNFDQVEVDIPPGLVFILGSNGQGKTNLLEAIYFLAISKSYRAHIERELIPWRIQTITNEKSASVEQHIYQTIISADIAKLSGIQKIIAGLQMTSQEGYSKSITKKHFRVNGLSTSATNLIGNVNAVLFTAEDIQLIQGPPSQRRRFLDILISQVDRTYLKALMKYQKIIIQRNHLLRLIRDGNSSKSQLEFWNDELSKEGITILKKRIQAIESLTPFVTKSHSTLSNNENLSLNFHPSISPDDLHATLISNINADINTGITSIGPHRDDIGISIDGIPANNYASRGQSRTIALSLRLAESAYLMESRGEEPILLLDDVLSELDENRRLKILEQSTRYQQVLVTSADPILVDQGFTKQSTKFIVEHGQINQVKSTHQPN